MSGTTAIEWTDRTWNPLTGCTKVSPGCDNCYAKTMHERFNGPGSFDTVTLHPDRLDQPLRWRKPARVFVNSMSDLFHQDVPVGFIAQTFAVMAISPHTFQVLTKRHARMRSTLASETFIGLVYDYAEERLGAHLDRDVWPLPNVWLGVSVEDQQWADIRIPALLDTPAAVRFLSCEPLLGPIDLRQAFGRWTPGEDAPWCADKIRVADVLRWVIVGGESGHGARPMHPDWARALRDQCVAASVPFLFKQWGEFREWGGPSVTGFDRYTVVERDGEVHPPLGMQRQAVDRGAALMERVGKKAAGRELDGRTWDEYPESAA